MIAISTAMIEMTTNNSMSVNPLRLFMAASPIPTS